MVVPKGLLGDQGTTASSNVTFNQSRAQREEKAQQRRNGSEKGNGSAPLVYLALVELHGYLFAVRPKPSLNAVGCEALL
jgi:hypothetical protein